MVVSLGRGLRDDVGESVLIQRPDMSEGGRRKRFVVDLGHSWSHLYRPAIEARPDVVILTHDDADHIGGAVDGLHLLHTQGPHRHREVWLPADWLLVLVAWGTATGALPASSFGGPTVGPMDIVAGHELPPMDHSDDAEHRDVDLGAMLGPVVDTREDDIDGYPMLEGLGEFDLEAVVQGMAREIRNARRRHRSRGPAGPVGTARRAAASLEKILAIIREARQCGRVRWFSPDVPPYSNLRNPHREELWILNAGEVTSRHLPKVDRPYLFLALMLTEVTPQNRRALVTVVHPTPGAKNGAIVWSDSTGEKYASPANAPWSNSGLMTAPHHASMVPAHQIIWNERNNQASDTAVLLSENSHPTTPVYTLLCGLHACTRCHLHTGPGKPGRDAVAHWCRSCSGWSLAEV